LRDETGHRFMRDEHHDAELAPRDVVARAIWRRLQGGGEVYLDATHLGESFPQRFPTVFASAIDAGIDPRHEWLPVSPAAHYHMGGIAVDEAGRASLRGLYACGEVSVTGFHGANRLASNSLLEGLVFGVEVAKAIDDAPPVLDVRAPVEVPYSALRVGLWEDEEAVGRLRRVMWDHVGVMRTGDGLGKALAEIAGAPLVSWSLRAIGRCRRVGGVVVAAPPSHVDEVQAAVPPGLGIPVEVVAGGSSRQRSVRAALEAVPPDAARIAVHDAARPLVTAAVFDAVFAALDTAPGAVIASPVADTLKQADAAGRISATVPRAGLWRAETPQAFHAGVLREVVASADEAELDAATDDASLAEARGVEVVLVDPGTLNLKVTLPADAVLVAALCS